MHKNNILTCIIDQLQADLSVLEQAVKLARDTATHGDCLGSSKYETMGLEASYLAQGQGVRLLEVERALTYFKALVPLASASKEPLGLSSLFILEDDEGNTQQLWLATEAGGLKVHCDHSMVTVITPQSPLGAAMMGKYVGDNVELSMAGTSRCYEVIDIIA